MPRIDPEDVLVHPLNWTEITSEVAHLYSEFHPVVSVYSIQGRRHPELVRQCWTTDLPYLNHPETRFYKLKQASPQGNDCDDKNNNRSRFFEQLPGLLVVAKQLNVLNECIVGLSSYESGWFDDHNVKLNNLWGLTQAGGNNIPFLSIQAGNDYFVTKVGPFIKGAQTIPVFFAGLKKEGYNSANPNYFSQDLSKGMLFNRISNIKKWAEKCGKSL
jgi:hypothetical protein